MGFSDSRDWSIGGVARLIVSDVRTRPVALVLALAVAPTLWYLPATALYDAVVPPSGSDGSARSLAAHLVVMVATAAWWAVMYAGQLQIAIDVARGGRVEWSRFPKGVHHTGRAAVTALPCMLPLSAVIVLPDAPWVDVWAVFLVPAAVGTAVVLTARLVLWAPLAIDRGLALGAAFSVAWSSSRGQAWRLIRLGLALGLPFLPVFILEMVFLGNSWLATGIVGALYAMATAHLYVGVSIAEARLANLNASAPAGLVPKTQDELNVPQAGSGWSRPFE
jgi:hypothetical protein